MKILVNKFLCGRLMEQNYKSKSFIHYFMYGIWGWNSSFCGDWKRYKYARLNAHPWRSQSPLIPNLIFFHWLCFWQRNINSLRSYCNASVLVLKLILLFVVCLRMKKLVVIRYFNNQSLFQLESPFFSKFIYSVRPL